MIPACSGFGAAAVQFRWATFGGRAVQVRRVGVDLVYKSASMLEVLVGDLHGLQRSVHQHAGAHGQSGRMG